MEATARKIAFLPIVHGGLGLRSSALLSPAAHWAAWADVLPIIAERAPELGARVLQELEAEESSVPSVRRAVAADRAVAQPEFRAKPTWQELVDGARPPERLQQYDEEPGQWPHGWQFYASLGPILQHREHEVLPTLDAAMRARVRSQSGAHAGDHLTALPTCEYTIASPLRMNAMLRRRARLPLAFARRDCRAAKCQRLGVSQLDEYGDHPAACPRTGALRRRGAAVERAFRPLWVEAPVQADDEHPLVRALEPTVPTSDGRQADVLVRGLSIGGSLPIVGDMCMAACCTWTGPRTWERTRRTAAPSTG